MRQTLIVLPTFILALLILFVSIYKTAEIKYNFSPSPAPIATDLPHNFESTIPEVGDIAPGSILWPLRVALDKGRLTFASNPKSKSELLIKIANNRLANATKLIRKGDISEGVSTLTKAEKYLELAMNAEKEARNSGYLTHTLATKLNTASKMHQEVISALSDACGGEAQAIVVKISEYPKLVYDQTLPLILANDTSLTESQIHE